MTYRVMDIRVLRYVVAVADQLNFTAAARGLHVSQPALSQQIRALEEELKLRVFARTPRGVTITQGGSLVVEHARRVIGTAARLREEVDAYRGARRGQLRLGVTQSFNALHLPSVLASFLRAQDGVDVTVRELPNPLIMHGVASGTLDLGIAFGAADEAVAARPLYEDRLMLACASGHRLAHGSTVALECLEGETLALLTDDFSTRRELDLFLSLHEVVPGRIVCLNTFAAIMDLVATGACVSIVPAWPRITAGPSPVRFVRMEPSPAPRLTHVVLPPQGTEAPPAILFWDLLYERFTRK